MWIIIWENADLWLATGFKEENWIIQRPISNSLDDHCWLHPNKTTLTPGTAFPNYCRWTSPHLRFPKGTSTLALHTTSGFCVVCCSTLESRHHWFAWLSWPCTLHVKAAQMQVIEVDLQTAISLGSTLVLCEHLTSGGPPVLICPFSGTAFLSLQVQGTSVSLLSRSDTGQEGLPSYFSYLCNTIYENVDHFRITWVNHFCKMLLGEFAN